MASAFAVWPPSRLLSDRKEGKGTQKHRTEGCYGVQNSGKKGWKTWAAGGVVYSGLPRPGDLKCRLGESTGVLSPQRGWGGGEEGA